MPTKAQARLPPPGFETNWKDFGDLCVELTRAAGRPGVWAANDASGRNFALDAWLRQRGKGLFTTTGLGFGADDAREWFDYWADLRQRGGAGPAGGGTGIPAGGTGIPGGGGV